jgi:tetratricopeptide (TPR) repeat protein
MLVTSEHRGDAFGLLSVLRSPFIPLHPAAHNRREMANPIAAQLKEEGNQFFAAKKYRSALAKYTQAIELDGTNAILYANRAQCEIQLKLYAIILLRSFCDRITVVHSYTPAECDAKKVFCHLSLSPHRMLDNESDVYRRPPS